MLALEIRSRTGFWQADFRESADFSPSTAVSGGSGLRASARQEGAESGAQPIIASRYDDLRLETKSVARKLRSCLDLMPLLN
jgi:hypothetical protein